MAAGDALTYRERFARTLAHQAVDRPPMDLGATDMTYMVNGTASLAPYLSIESQENMTLEEAVMRALDVDIRGVGGIVVPQRNLSRRISDTRFVNPWGITYQVGENYAEICEHPLAGCSIDDLDAYPWPQADDIDPSSIAEMRERARYLYEETPYIVCGRHPYFGVMELGCWMCGFDDFLYRMAAEPEFIAHFFHIVLEYQKRVDEIYFGALGRYLHYITSGDDFGTQKAPFLSPAMFDELVFPVMRERIRHTRLYSDAAFFHHSCGAIHPLIPSLIKMGVEILNPIQPHATNMEPERLLADFGTQLTFYGGIDTQHLLPHGTAEEVYQETRLLITLLGSNGGYILSAAHVFQPDVPAENIIAMYRAGQAAI